jgi:hypothetical protein
LATAGSIEPIVPVKDGDMDWSDRIVAALAGHSSWAYHGNAPKATEPAALSALALLGHQQPDAAQELLDWLASIQSKDGCIGVTEAQDAPHWPTSQAILAWWHAQQLPKFAGQYQQAIDRAVRWTLQTAGVALQPTPELGHDPTLVGWPWVESTHSWQEPTCWAVLALRTAGHAAHARTREGIRMLVDRLLPDGGCNYGNSYVLGQQLRPHVQPTGICLLALAGEPIADARIQKSIDYLQRELSDKTTTASLSYGLLGLAAQGHGPANADAFLTAAATRTFAADPSAHKLALLALAALGSNCPLMPTPAGSTHG